MEQNLDCDTGPRIRLSCLIANVGVNAFAEQIWGSASHLSHGVLAPHPQALLSLESFEVLLSTLGHAHADLLHLARGGRRPIPREMITADGSIDLRRVRKAFAAGDTLYVRRAQQFWPALARSCRAVHLDLVAAGLLLQRPVDAHVFVTPPGSRAFPIHRDEHANFVLQLEGSKEWTIYQPDDASIRMEVGEVDQASLGGTVAQRFVLEAGDVLYFPEWWPHEAHTLDAHSLHVTMRAFPLRWRDLVQELSASRRALAQRVPRALRAEDISTALAGLIQAEFSGPSVRESLDELVRRQAIPRTSLPSSGLREVLNAGSVTLATCVIRNDETPCSIVCAEDGVSLLFPGGAIRGPRGFLPVLEFVASQSAFVVRDLPPKAEGDYDRIAIVKRMIHDGLLRVAEI